MTVASLRDSIKTALATIATAQANAGLRNVLTPLDHWPENPPVPAAWVRPASSEALTLDRSTSVQRFEIVVVVALGDFAAAQDQLDAYYTPSGTYSIEAALFASADLDDQILDYRQRDYGDIEIAEQSYVGFVADVEILL
jgi:hypothetical protein